MRMGCLLSGGRIGLKSRQRFFFLDDDVDDDVPLHITLKVPVNLKNVLEEHLNKTFGNSSASIVFKSLT